MIVGLTALVLLRIAIAWRRRGRCDLRGARGNDESVPSWPGGLFDRLRTLNPARCLGGGEYSSIEHDRAVNFDETGTRRDGRQIILPRFMAVQLTHFVLEFLASVEVDLFRQIEVQFESRRLYAKVGCFEADST